MPPTLRKLASTTEIALLALALGVCAWIKADGPNGLSYFLFLIALVFAYLYLQINIPKRRP
jgi:hypothetical protein